MSNARESKIFAAIVGVFGLAYRAPACVLPALSLPNMLAPIRVMGTKKTLVFSALIVVVATISGMIYGRVG